MDRLEEIQEEIESCDMHFMSDKWLDMAKDLLPAVEAAEKLTEKLAKSNADGDWVYQYNNGVEAYCCIYCDAYQNDPHQEPCYARILNEALQSLRDNPPAAPDTDG